jgi:2-polyprenyl-3-methyl-5-hydroxy-6-metoxy-1,4-benzoquinol methylase
MSSWQEKSKDPNLELVRRERRDLLDQALRRSPVDRISFITDLVYGKRTLDIGCVTHDASYAAQADWLHGHVAKAASYCLGLDILEPDVELLRAQGYNVLCHDITRSPVSQKFDVIVCGEIAEHIGNIDGLLANCRTCLEPEGRLVLTTPYPWFLGVTLRHSMRGAYFPGSVDHVAWYDPSNIAELAIRHGYELESSAGVVPLPQRGGVGRNLFEGLVSTIRKGWMPFISPLVGCRSLIYVLRAR